MEQISTVKNVPEKDIDVEEISFADNPMMAKAFKLAELLKRLR